MILVYCFCTRDQQLALENVKWWNELGGCKGHKALVWRDRRTDVALCEQLKAEFERCFDSVEFRSAGADIDGWPEGANYFMRIAATVLQDRSDCRYFFWMEPDAIPLKSGWLDAIEAEYKSCGKPFMGDRVQVGDIPLHMSGVGVYWNPLHQKAGEAYRAHDTAWDMAAKDQIAPQAHFTKLIEHAWKHPSFTNANELQTQIRPEAVLFHSSKDGSLIHLLRAQKNFPAAPVLAEPKATECGLTPITVGQVGEARESMNSTERSAQDHKLDSRGGGETLIGVDYGHGESRSVPTCDIFIRTYAPDYDWLRYCVEAIDKFASGFRKVWIISPHNPPVWMQERGRGMLGTIPIDWRIMNEEAPDGYLSQQIHKLYADAITGYEADYYLHIDSDVILTQPITPKSFFVADKVIWPFTPYAAIETPWKPITETFLGRPVEYEFMRRFPIMVPKWLYGKLREFAHHQHGRIISEYIRTRPHREFSEFNALGAYAYEFHRGEFMWFNTTTTTLDAPFGKQYHSWSGMTPEIKTEIEQILSGEPSEAPGKKSVAGNGSGDSGGLSEQAAAHDEATIRITNDQITSGTGVVESLSAQKIKKLPNGIWVIEGDQISGWVEEAGKLDHDPNLLPVILSHINEGDTVIDCGAFIGDHTIAYARKARHVVAFEPNPIAFECLVHNLRVVHYVELHNCGLSDREEIVPLSGNNNQPSGGYVGEHMKVADVEMRTLDSYELRPNLIKIDVEGCELKALRGAEKTIDACHPKMVIEMNVGALARQGADPGQVFAWLTDHGYQWGIIEADASVGDPLYNIIALPGTDEKTRPVTAEAGSSKSPVAAPSVSGNSPLTPYGEMLAHVEALANYCTDGFARMRVIRQLQRHKIVKKRKRK